MSRTNKQRSSGWVSLLACLLLVAGCASYKGQLAFDKAEQFAAEENFDQAVEKYFEATEFDPGNKTYKLKLIATRTSAAAAHIKKARGFAKEGKIDEALVQYRMARGFDPSLEVASQEEQVLRDLRAAETHANEAADFYRERRLTLARKALDKALDLDPNNARALAIKNLLEREQKTIDYDGIELDVASEEPITLKFKDANIKEVFSILNQLTGINFIFDEDIRDQSISVLLEKASFAQAMELILQMNGLGKKVLNSKTIILYPQSREKAKQYEDQIIQTFYLSHIDAKKAVNMLRTMLQLRKIYVHEERNALVIRDQPEVIRLAEQILEAADRENSEVIFSLELLAVQNTDNLLIGPKLSQYSVSAGFSKDNENIVSSTLPDDGTVGNTIKSLNGLQTFYTLPSAVFDFAKTLTDTEVLASPKIRVRNKEKAKVHIGTREPVITVTTTNNTSTDNIQYVDVGVKVDVEPTIQLDNTVETKLTLEVSQVIDRVTTTNGSVALTISTTNAQSTLTLKDGVQTILGGLFEQQATNTVNTVPLLGDIPIIGKLFSSVDDQDTKREILLSITPYIVKQVEVPDDDIATIWSGGEDNLKAGPNFGAFAKPLVSEVEELRPAAVPALDKMELSEPLEDLEVKADVPTKVLASSATQPPEIEGTEQPQTELPAVAPLAGSPGAEEGALDTSPTAVVSEAAVTPPVVTEVTPPASLLPETTVATRPPVLEMPKKGPARLAISGPQSVDTGMDFTLAVEVEDVEQLYSAPLFVSYDPVLLELTGVNEGTFLKQDGQSTVFSNSPNRTTGQLIVGYKQGAGGKGRTGSGMLFTLNFRAKASGSADVKLNRVNFRNPEGTRLTVEPASVTIEIN